MNQDDEIFASALELPAAERAVFLDRACAGDPARRARVAALLAGHDAATHFLEDSPVVRPDPVPLPEEKPGDVLGRYTLVRKIGDGGCGVVYLAEQREPLRRLVALKVIRLGMDTREVIARFEGERQALALMDHPDIARVFDAGSTEAGRPFFAMEFVDGVPITKFCDQHNLGMAARLELFARVCLAVQHAHQKGIIHRDLKPSNILVAMHDGGPAPKVIDFGIAKATHGRLTEHTLLTGLGQFIGTPAYMSPEQTELRELDIDTRSDIYGLGVLLYELLTGRPPYDPTELVRAGLDEIRRIIREVEPPRPSTRVSTLTDADRATVARQRRSAPLQLSAVLRGDLDWIVMRCLEKDRERRYGTAHELAADVRRHLRQEPVVARPPTALYRLQRFIARNRLACASAAALATALILGTVVSVRQAVRATRAEGVARTERDAAQTATRAETVARTDAQRRQEQAEALLTFMLGDFRTELKKIGKLNLLDAIGDKALAHFAALDPKDLTDTVLTSQARALTQIGETRLDQARYTEATAAFTAALDRVAALFVRHPQNADMLFERAQAEFWLGFVARRRGDFAQAREWLVRYRDSALALQQLEGDTPRARIEVISGLRNLAVADFDANDLPAAERGFRTEREALERQLAIAPTDTVLRGKLAEAIGWLATLAEKDGRYRDALTCYRGMNTSLADLLHDEGAVTKWRYRLAESHTHMARVLAISGNPAEAVQNLERASALLAPISQADPANQEWRSVALTYQVERILLLLSFSAEPPSAVSVRELRQELESLFAQAPKSRPFARRLALALLLEAKLPASTPGEGLALVTRARALLAPLTKGTNIDTPIEGDFARACLLEARFEEKLGRSERTKECWEQVVALLGNRAAQSNDWRVLDPLAQALVLLGREDSARPVIEKLKSFGYRPMDPDAATTLQISR